MLLAPHKLIGRGMIRRFGFAGVNMVLLEEVCQGEGRVWGFLCSGYLPIFQFLLPARWKQDWGIAETGLILFLLEEIWTLGLWIRKSDECFKHSLRSHSSRNTEASSDPKMLGISKLWNICQGEQLTGTRTSPRESSVLHLTKMSGVRDLKSVLTSEIVRQNLKFSQLPFSLALV